MRMKLSDDGLAKIASNEGFSETAYFDHKGWSIGYGHLMTAAERLLYAGVKITQADGRDFLSRDAANAELHVNTSVKVPLTQEQFDALVDFTYNEGGALEHIAATLNSDTLHDDRYKAAAAHMSLYNKVRDEHGNLVVSKGLVARRAQEAAAFEV